VSQRWRCPRSSRHVPWKFKFLPRDPGLAGNLHIPQPACHVRSSVSKTFSKFVPPIRSLPALPIMFTNALSRRKAAVACVAVSMSSIRALGQSTSQIFGPSRRRVPPRANHHQVPVPAARARLVAWSVGARVHQDLLTRNPRERPRYSSPRCARAVGSVYVSCLSVPRERKDFRWTRRPLIRRGEI